MRRTVGAAGDRMHATPCAAPRVLLVTGCMLLSTCRTVGAAGDRMHATPCAAPRVLPVCRKPG
eukprot:350521-Chlamydomonas_euryale.AAC.9